MKITNLEYKAVISALSQHLDEEHKLQKELDKVLTTELLLKNRKSLLMLQKWHEDVYEPLATQIHEEMNCRAKDLHELKRSQYSKYLKHANKKEGHVFLDVYEKLEYDPLLCIKNQTDKMKAVTKRLKDPLLHRLLSYEEENSFFMSYDTGIQKNRRPIKSPNYPPLPFLPLSRSGVSCKSWLDMELRDIQSAVRKKSQKRLLGIRNHSNVLFHGKDDGDLATVKNNPSNT